MIDYDPEADALEALAGVSESEVNEIQLDGIPLALDLLVQCGGCLERGEQTPLRVQWSNDSGVDLGDLAAQCPRCSELAGIASSIPIVIATGQDADEIDEALALSDDLAAQGGGVGDLPPIDDGSHPFEGPATAERPIQLPVDE